MPLTGYSVVKQKLILDHVEKSIRPASYDVTVGEVLIKGERQAGQAIIRPQQTFVIVSRETVQIPSGQVAYAVPKTGLCNAGILALNTGLIDPGYKGKVSTIAINFSNADYRMSKDEPFLRLVFGQLHGEGEDVADKVVPEADDIRIARSKHFPGTFLDVGAQVERLTTEVTRDVTNDILDRQRTGMTWLIGIMAFLFVLWNFGSYYLLSRQASTIAARTESSELHSGQMAVLEMRLKSVEEELSRLSKAPAPIVGPSRKPK